MQERGVTTAEDGTRIVHLYGGPQDGLRVGYDRGKTIPEHIQLSTVDPAEMQEFMRRLLSGEKPELPVVRQLVFSRRTVSDFKTRETRSEWWFDEAKTEALK